VDAETRKKLYDHSMEIGRYLRVPSSLGEMWRGVFALGKYQVEINATGGWFNGDMGMTLVNHQEVETPSGAGYIVDYLVRGDTIRIGRSGDDYTVYMHSGKENKEIMRADVDIQFDVY